ncbi:Reducing polyketide synthase DEP5 [Paramyrothecium foliicola]|nr:Reducing polyketide synthase DEP5 [Paramyrothecium foliicola]
MAPSRLPYVFYSLSVTAVFLLWVLMGFNGTLHASLKAAITGKFPDGRPLRLFYTGIPGFDTLLAILISFFDPLTNLVERAPYLMTLDLVGVVHVVNLLALIESRRATSKWLRVPAFWQFLYNCAGVAAAFPVWAKLYVQQDLATKKALSRPDAQALPFTAMFNSLLPAFLFVPVFAASSATQAQFVLSLYFFLPPIFVLFQSQASRIIAITTFKGFRKPARLAYLISGMLSAAIHVGVVSYIVRRSSVGPTLARVYIPNVRAVRWGQINTLTEGALLFVQFDYWLTVVVVILLGSHILKAKKEVATGQRTSRGGAISTFLLMLLIFGPGAGVAYASYIKESQVDLEEASDSYPTIRFAMPGLLRTSSSSSQVSDGSRDSSQSTSLYGDYPALSFPGYAEKPLDEQLEPIAVIGMGCRLPGDVSSPAGFWDMMINKGTGNTPKVPASRFNIDAHFHKNNDRPGSFGVLGGYFLKEELSDFDPGLFGITPIEAMWMDPQQRKLLEVVYEAFESGGTTLEAISGSRTAVFAACFTADWQQMAFKEPSFRHSLAATGVDPGIISNRISHVFNLNGPSIVVNTACSSSVYALHNACNALRNNECEGAVVGGVNLVITVDQHMNTAKLGVLSPTSTCHTFDESANGYGRADAVGAVYMKRLSDAVRDGDPIRGVIRSSAVNSNGKVPAVGITHPNREGQADVISQAYKRGGDLDPRLTGYFECHGTGTAVGDPLEVHAVSMAMNKERKPDDVPLWVGAVKTNIGHSEAASGLSALIKAILMVERGVIPPTRGLVKPSPAIKWEEWKVKVPTEPVPFPSHLPVRRVSINSFGYGGTNAHLVIEGAESLVRQYQNYKYIDNNDPKRVRVPRRALQRKRPFLLPFSAHDKPTLKRNIDAHGKIVDKYDLIDLSYTLANRRSNLLSKAFTVASHGTVTDAFENVATSFTFAEKKKKVPTVGFVFTGQGAQWARMGAELMEHHPSFLRSIRVLDFTLGDLHDGPDWSIEDILLEPAETSRVSEAEFSQPLCTAIQVAVVQLLNSWGVRPVVTVGHSSGEIAAAYAAGLVSAKEAIVAAYYRGKVVKDINTGGAMMAVGLGAEAAEPYLANVQGKVTIACHNSPAGVTLSGDADALESVKAKLDAESIFARMVKTNGKAYHSHHMAPVADQYERLVHAGSSQIIADLPLETATNVKMVSSVTNSVLPQSTVLEPSYWSANLRSPVLFNQAVQTILTSEEFADVDLLIEVGPHSAMAGPIKQIKSELKAEKLDYLPTLLRGTDSATQLLKLAGELFLRNYPLDMQRVTMVEETSPTGKVLGTQGQTIVDLPPYQWNYTKPFWAESRTSREQRQPKFPRHDVLGQLVIGCSLAEPTWRNVLRSRDLPWLKDHFLGGESVFPAAGYFSMAIEAITQLNDLADKPVEVSSYVLRDVSIKKALVTPDDDNGVEVMFNMRPSVFDEAAATSAWWDFSVSSIDGEGVQREHMAGSVSINTRSEHRKARAVPEFPQRASGKAWNQALREVGFDYGPTFQDMDDIRFDGKVYEASCTTNIKQFVDESLGESRYVLHPATVDSTLQLCITAIYAGRTTAMDCGVVPIQLDEMTIWPPTEKQLEAQKANAYSWVTRRGLRTSESSVQMTAEDGELVMEMVNMRATSYEAAVPQKAETALKEAPYGEVTWAVDFDSLATAPNFEPSSVSELVNLALFKRPNLKVLELGSKNALDVLNSNSQASYTVSVTTDEDLEVAKSVFKPFNNAKTIKLDLSEDFEAQGIKSESFDLLIAPGDAPSVEVLAVLRRLLKTGGHAIWEFTQPGSVEALQEAGFNGLDFALPGKSGTIVASSTAQGDALEAEVIVDTHAVQLIYRDSPAPIVQQVKSVLEALGWQVTVSALSECLDAKIESHVIVLADFEGPLLYTLKEDEFLGIQAITNSASSLLWATTGAFLEGKKPEFALISGLARAVGAEQASLDFRTLDFDLDTVEAKDIPATIADIAQSQLAETETPEREICVSGGKRYISRLGRNSGLNEIFTATQNTEPRSFTPGDRISGKILKNKVVFQQEVLDDAEVKPGHVEVQVEASGLTKEGVLVITGADYPQTFSHEIGGTVTRVGAGVGSLKAGDKVVGFHADKFASFQEVPATLLHKLEASDDVDGVVGLLMPYAAAYYGLELARLKPKESVLILHSTGAAGTAAINITLLSGAIPFVVVKSEEEAEFLKTQFGLSDQNIIPAANTTDRLTELTHGKGVDVVFSAGSVEPSAAREAWRHIARFGRFVDAGRKDVLSRNALDTVPVARGASYTSFDIVELYEARPEVISHLLSEIVKLFKNGSLIAPGTLQNVNLADINKAVASFTDDFGAAKSVVKYEHSEESIQVLPARTPLRFNPEHTYLLVGCLGGLGRSLTSWMMESGARRFTFLSRSGTDSKSAAKLVKDITDAGAIVQVVRGDATSRDDVVRAVQGVSPENPIKGVIHAAMVLRDGLFHSMPYSNWKTAVEPKILGAVNLHSVLSETPLDFFVMTSSVSGILGNPGQSNYAAANSYLDSLARHRHIAEKPATSLVLPMVLGVGVVAENTQLEDALLRKGMYGIDEEHLLEGFEAAIVSNKQDTDLVVVGLDAAKLQKAANDPIATDVFWLEDARFSHVVHDMRSAADDATSSGAQSILATIKAAGSAAEAVQLVTEHFVEKLTRMLMLGPDDFEVDVKSIADYGVDSMIGAELRNWIFKEYKMDIPFQQLLGPTLTITKFAGQVCGTQGIEVAQ